MWLQVLLFLVVTDNIQLAVSHGSSSKDLVLSTPSGRIRGSILTTRLGQIIYSFRGIRYAKPPVGNLRFKPPVPIGKWSGVYDATQDKPLCPQPAIYGVSSEDCLYVNVYTTKLPDKRINAKRPVLIFFHPGAFYHKGGASYWFGPQYMTDVDVVLVTFNYRLGSLGFISTGDECAPGNYGLRDQVELLWWVKKHIASFGGDPDNVTIHGSGAGAWSVILQMVSAMTRGRNLFHRAAIASAPINLDRLPNHQFDLAKKQAELLGCPCDTSESIIDCLRKVPVKDLAESVSEFKEFGDEPSRIWSPVIDGEFLTDDPIRLIMENQFDPIPVMIGQTKEETGYKAFYIIDNETLLEEMNSNFETVAPICFLYERDTCRSTDISRAIREFYFENREITKSELNNLANLFNDALIGFGVHRYAKLLAEYNTQPVYKYLITYRGRYSHFYLPGTANETWGVVHGDELIYVYYMQIAGFPPIGNDSPQLEAQMVDIGLKTFYYFASIGNPLPKRNPVTNVTWAPSSHDTLPYMDIGSSMIMKENLNEERYQFWEELFPLDLY